VELLDPDDHDWVEIYLDCTDSKAVQEWIREHIDTLGVAGVIDEFANGNLIEVGDEYYDDDESY
jgi:hypothetical protein